MISIENGVFVDSRYGTHIEDFQLPLYLNEEVHTCIAVREFATAVGDSNLLSQMFPFIATLTTISDNVGDGKVIKFNKIVRYAEDYMLYTARDDSDGNVVIDETATTTPKHYFINHYSFRVEDGSGNVLDDYDGGYSNLHIGSSITVNFLSRTEQGQVKCGKHIEDHPLTLIELLTSINDLATERNLDG